jgi:hypothetical protein
MFQVFDAWAIEEGLEEIMDGYKQETRRSEPPEIL